MPDTFPTFDRTFHDTLPLDPNPDNRRRPVLGAVGSLVTPTTVPDPTLRAWSREVAETLGLPAQPLDTPEAARLAQIFAGNEPLPGAPPPWANAYAGHQFGSWAGQLGDGRAISLGHAKTGQGLRELQLKGAGPTPYSRTADGRAVLRSSIREFLCSEAMAHLGVPTTRALSLVTTGQGVLRDMFYDGNPRLEPGAIVCRVAPSFLRFGSFELFASRGDVDNLRRLAGYAIGVHFPALLGEDTAGDARDDARADWQALATPERVAAFFAQIARRTAVMVAHWARVGFVHGVMNTDNMSIHGLTIDYGPYGWLDDYNPDWTPNTTDAGTRRYRFGQQPAVAGWNLERLANALHPLVGQAEPLVAGMRAYTEALDEAMTEQWAAKLGLSAIDADEPGDDPRTRTWLITEANDLLQLVETDMTRFFRALADVPMTEAATEAELLGPLEGAYYTPPDEHPPAVRQRTAAWLRTLAQQVRADGLDVDARRERMNGANPVYVLRNYLAQQAIDAAEDGDFSEVHTLLDVIRRPYTEQLGREAYAALRPDWARTKPGCSMLSCSS